MLRRIINLSGETWRLGQAPAGARPGSATWQELDQVDEWLPARVPGNVRADLIRAGRLPELHFGAQAEAAQWVDDHCWWLVREFDLAVSPAERVHLVLRGVDYIWDLYLNGQHLGHHEGMFSRRIYDITGMLRASNRLAVRITGSRWLPRNRSGPWDKLLNHVEAWSGSLPGHFPHRRDTLKCQMGFGWDFAPPLRTMGVWDDVYAVVSGNVFIRDVVTRQEFSAEQVVLTAEVELDASVACQAQLRCTLAGATFDGQVLADEQQIELAPGRNHRTVKLAVPEPRLWWPWDHGRPDLYRLTVEVLDGSQPLDSITQTTGLRQVELEGWTLRINGRRVYARGANWVPADILPGRVTRADYQALLSRAREANMNMLRVWGGALREKDAFYDLCDRLGILVWQEFPFACAFLARFPRDPSYLHLVEAETTAIIRDLRNHPSLALWCGGNEFSPERNEPLVDVLHRAVRDGDPTRPFLPASPAKGDSHNWQVWHHYEPPSAYRQDGALFASEFGLQAAPDAGTLRRFIPAEELWPPGPSWAYHGADLKKLWRYARPFLEEQNATLEAFIRASQRAQAQALQTAIEHYRRAKARGGGGVLVWQLNEPWPAISWALLDYYRQPKPAFEVVKRLLHPLLISVDYAPRQYQRGDKLCGEVWIINDGHDEMAGCRAEVALLDGAGQRVQHFAQPVRIAADSAEIVGRFCWELGTGADWRLACSLIRGDQALASNEYDLAMHDDCRPTRRQRLRSWLSGVLTNNPAVSSVERL